MQEKSDETEYKESEEEEAVGGWLQEEEEEEQWQDEGTKEKNRERLKRRSKKRKHVQKAIITMKMGNSGMQAKEEVGMQSGRERKKRGDGTR